MEDNRRLDSLEKRQDKLELVITEINESLKSLVKVEQQNQYLADRLNKLEQKAESCNSTGCYKLSDITKKVERLEGNASKIVWGILTAVGMAVMGLVIK